MRRQNEDHENVQVDTFNVNDNISLSLILASADKWNLTK